MTKPTELRVAVVPLLVLSLLIPITPATARAYRVLGAGGTKCVEWTRDFKTPASPDALQDAQWVLGFLSGLGHKGVDGDDPLKDMESRTVLAWISKYCAEHEGEDADEAAMAFYKYHPR